MTEYYFGGTEAATHRNLLLSTDAVTFGLSFIGLSKRVKHLDKWNIDAKYPERVRVFLNSGAFSLNGDDDKYTMAEIGDLESRYRAYVEQNLDNLEYFTDFDATQLDKETLDANRELYHSIGGDKFVPVWHSEWGVDALQNFARIFKNIGVISTSLSGRNLAPLLNSIANSGVQLHAIGNTSVEDLQGIKWTTTTSSSWFSPQQHGDFILWVGKTLKRYPKRDADQAKRKYRTYVNDNGFDAELLETGDSNEALRVSVWSWLRFMEDLERRHSRPQHLRVVTNPTLEADEDSGADLAPVVVLPTAIEPSSPPTKIRRETVPLPGFTTETKTVTIYDVEGNEVESTLNLVGKRTESARMCDTCFLAAKCPAYLVGSNCAFDIDLEVRNKDQERAVQAHMIEMQFARVKFMQFVEDQEGGYADPNLSKEIDRLQKMLKVKHDMDTEKFSFKIEASGTAPAQASLLSRLLGPGEPKQLEVIESHVIDADEIIEGQFTEEPEGRE